MNRYKPGQTGFFWVQMDEGGQGYASRLAYHKIATVATGSQVGTVQPTTFATGAMAETGRIPTGNSCDRSNLSHRRARPNLSGTQRRIFLGTTNPG